MPQNPNSKTMNDMVTAAEQMSKQSPNFLPWKITIQKVHKILGGLPCFIESELQRISYYLYPVSFFNLQDSSHVRQHLPYRIHSLSELEGVSFPDS